MNRFFEEVKPADAVQLHDARGEARPASASTLLPKYYQITNNNNFPVRSELDTASRNSSRRDVSFFQGRSTKSLSRRKSLSTTETYYLEGRGSLELSTITAGQAKWTARWQTRIPGQRTIEAWTCLHIVLSEPAGRNSFGPPAARSTRRLSSPRQTEFDLVHVHHRSRRDSPVSTGVR